MKTTKLLFTTVAALALQCFEATPTYSQVPDSFNPGANDEILSLALQPDGKVLAGGWFTTLGGQTRNYLGRLNADGALDITSNLGADGYVQSLGVQPDGKTLVGGQFTTLGGQPRNYIGRLNADGSVDLGFNPGADYYVYALAMQSDGKIVVGGYFDALGGEARSRIGRLNANGSLDTAFNPGAFFPGGNNAVYCLALQPDGKILVGGGFSVLGGQPRASIGRLNPDGTVDASFNPGASGDPFGGTVLSLAVLPDGKILVGGTFTTVGGQPRERIARLNADGTLDSSYNPGANAHISSFAPQVDGKALVAGNFTMLGGQVRNRIGRLNANGTLDPTFDPGAGVNSTVQSLALQTDGKVLVAGNFTTLGGQARNYLGRLENTGPATQNLAYDGATATWLRGGTSPEVWRTSFDRSIDGTNWVALGAGTRIPGGWQLTGVSVPPNSTLRARGFVAGGYLNSSGWFVESSVRTVAPILDIHTYAGLTIMGTVGVTYQIQYKTSLNNTNWTPLVDLMLPTNPYLYVDTNSPATGQRFYRAVFTNSVPMP